MLFGGIARASARGNASASGSVAWVLPAVLPVNPRPLPSAGGYPKKPQVPRMWNWKPFRARRLRENLSYRTVAECDCGGMRRGEPPGPARALLSVALAGARTESQSKEPKTENPQGPARRIARCGGDPAGTLSDIGRANAARSVGAGRGASAGATGESATPPGRRSARCGRARRRDNPGWRRHSTAAARA